jgi:hypothetical protein
VDRNLTLDGVLVHPSRAVLEVLAAAVADGSLRPLVTCPRCGNPAIYMVSEEFKLLDCEFCDDVIDVSDKELPELEPTPA